MSSPSSLLAPPCFGRNQQTEEAYLPLEPHGCVSHGAGSAFEIVRKGDEAERRCRTDTNGEGRGKGEDPVEKRRQRLPRRDAAISASAPGVRLRSAAPRKSASVTPLTLIPHRLPRYQHTSNHEGAQRALRVLCHVSACALRGHLHSMSSPVLQILCTSIGVSRLQSTARHYIIRYDADWRHHVFDEHMIVAAALHMVNDTFNLMMTFGLPTSIGSWCFQDQGRCTPLPAQRYLWMWKCDWYDRLCQTASLDAISCSVP